MLEDENRKLKKLLAESMLDNAALKELLAKNVWSAPALQGLSFCCRKQLA
jgi:putative transposase